MEEFTVRKCDDCGDWFNIRYGCCPLCKADYDKFGNKLGKLKEQ